MSKNLEYYFYLLFLFVSLIGNAAADFAILWLGTEVLQADLSYGIKFITAFYVGQSIGVIFLSPIFSQYVDRYSKCLSSITIDLLQASVYGLIFVFYSLDVLTYAMMIVFAILMSAFSSLHRNGITFSLLNEIKNHIPIEKVIKRFVYVFNFTLLFGVSFSGWVFFNYGFAACMLLAILSFVPMLFIYWRVFSENTSNKSMVKKKSIDSYLEAFRYVLNDKNLLGSSVATSLIYIAGGIYPAIVSIYAANANDTESASWLIAISILIATPFISLAPNLNRKIDFNKIVIVAFLPTAICLLLASFYANHYLVGFTFALNCIGFAFLNYSTINYRVASIPTNLISQVNTVYFAIMSMGQFIGCLFILPFISSYPNLILQFMALCFVLGGLVALKVCSSIKLHELSKYVQS